MNPGDGNGKVYVGIPRERMYIPSFVDNRDNILAHIHKSGIGVGYYQAEGHRVDRNRDKIVAEFIKHADKPEWLLMLDSDMEHPESIAERLIRFKKHVIAGLYFHRNESHDPFAFRKAADQKDQYGRMHRAWAPMRDEVYQFLTRNGVPFRDGAVIVDGVDDQALLECDAVATGTMLIHRSVLEAMMPGPWFEYKAGGISEDLQFCADIQEIYGFPRVFCDLSTISGHYSNVAMGQAQFRMNYENRGLNLSSYSKRHAIEMYADFFKIPFEKAEKIIQNGNAHVVGDYWKTKFNGKQPTPAQERNFYNSAAVGKLYILELLHWNFTPQFTGLRQRLNHIREQNVIEIGSGIGTVALQMIIQKSNCLAVETNAMLRDFIDMRYQVIHNALETELGDLSVVGEEWMENTAPESFDVAIALDVLEHLPEKTLRAIVQRLAYVLKPNGHLIYHANWFQQDIYPMHHNHEAIWNDILVEAGFVPMTPMDAIKVK